MNFLVYLHERIRDKISEGIKGEVVARHYVGDEPDIRDFPKTLAEYEKLNKRKDVS